MELKLLKKYFENSCSRKEAVQVQQWIERSDASTELEDEFNIAWQKIKVKSGDYQKWSEKLEKIHDRIEMEKLYGSLDTDRKKDIIEYKARDRAPKSGAEWRKNSRRKRGQYVMAGIISALILVFFTVAYVQFPEQNQQIETIGQIEKGTEAGQKLSFHLSDGTRVILNSGSKLHYPENFDSLERKVILEGEAFFEVSKDITRPFKVVTESVMTTALGTSFNICSFSSSENIEIALVTGKVSVKGIASAGHGISLILDPGEMATVIKSENSFAKSHFDFYQKISWKDGLIYFKDADYHEIVEKLENWYGVKFSENTYPSKEWKFSGRFEDETLNNILIALQFGHEFEYEMLGKEVKLNF